MYNNEYFIHYGIVSSTLVERIIDIELNKYPG